MSYHQPGPYCVQIELTEGCSLFCEFCGIHGVREHQGGPYKRLTVQAAEEIGDKIARAIDQDGWNPRIEFAMHGEPTMNREWPEIFAGLRKRLPRQSMMLTTNGTGLMRAPGPEHWIGVALESVNTVAIDAYEAYKVYEKIQAAVSFKIPFYPDEKMANPNARMKPTDRRVLFIRDISIAANGTHATLWNHAGAAGPLSSIRNGEQCAKPFRELSIRWDGRVAICCDDWRGKYPIGSFLEMEAEELWQHERFQAARRRLYQGRRDFGACKGCTHRTYRNGLLPDGNGKTKLEYQAGDNAIITAATTEGPMTIPVLRPWEL